MSKYELIQKTSRVICNAFCQRLWRPQVCQGFEEGQLQCYQPKIAHLLTNYYVGRGDGDPNPNA